MEQVLTMMNLLSSGLYFNFSNISAFGFRFGCDADGWMLKVNDEEPYPHFVHLFEPKKIKTVSFSGDALLSYIGFGPAGTIHLTFISISSCCSDLMPAPPVNYNLTYVCPEGQVFNHDWFAIPFILMTCQVIQ